MHLRRRLVASSLLLVTVLAGVAACSSGPERPSDPVLAKGQDVYNQRCQACHGPEGEGITAPAFFGIADRLSLDQHEATIRDGREGTRMAGFGETLSDSEIEAVARYEREVLGVRD